MTTDKDVAPTATVLERWKKEHSEKVQKKWDDRDALMEKMFNALLNAESTEEAVTFTIAAYRQHLRDKLAGLEGDAYIEAVREELS